MKGFKCQITAKVLFCKYKGNRNKKFAPVYVNFATETVINSEYNFNRSFPEILYRIDNWINVGPG